MGFVTRSIQASEALADAATSAAGATAGAVAGGLTGAVSGGVRGMGNGLNRGSRSVPAAALTIAAVGAAGLVDWPVLLAVGGSTLILRQLRHNPPENTQQTPTDEGDTSTKTRNTPTTRNTPKTRNTPSARKSTPTTRKTTPTTPATITPTTA
ncbi:MAG: hypothetical protein M3Y49_03605 [Actinomycetota bacterium]|nr:hypothetical protein [Actinomycetota bacterium]